MQAAEQEQGFVALYRQHYGVVLAYARRRTDEASARDVTAETFTIVWRRWPELGPPDLPWIYRTAALVLNNQERADRRQQRVVDRLAAQPELTPTDPSKDHADRAHIVGALGALSRQDRELLQLVAWEHLDTSGLAVVLGCSSGTAAVRLHRARRRFRTALAAWARLDSSDGDRTSPSVATSRKAAS